MERYVFDRHFQFKYDYANNHIIKDNEISYSELWRYQQRRVEVTISC